MNKKYTAKFKAAVALEAIKGDKTISQIASEYGIHPQQVRTKGGSLLKNAILYLKGTKTQRSFKANLKGIQKDKSTSGGNRFFISCVQECISMSCPPRGAGHAPKVEV